MAELWFDDWDALMRPQRSEEWRVSTADEATSSLDHSSRKLSFRIEQYTPVDDEVVIAGNWAFRRATFTWSVTSTAGGDRIRDSGKFIIIYQRQADGSWRVARDIWNSNSPPR